ncbi:MarR family winged helix-turn-helix transcriptional regulator [Ferviditalea candida]|uniref:MarR family transcriptional regulator n=1 Tax=Ferviditalea candida TaxID=3108399 RepID=A0ABU5ZN55_9BACL|nr:MarR family transcriptional regulator [Paenibacillaceae bacterium T2]
MDQDLEKYIQRFLSANESLRRKIGIEHRSLMEKNGTGMTRPQFFMLHIIKEHGPCKITQLAERLEVKPSAITVMIDRLVLSKLVMRTQDPNDRRVVLVELTEEGENELEKARDFSKQIISRYFSRLDSDELAQFVHTFEKIVRISNENSTSGG